MTDIAHVKIIATYVKKKTKQTNKQNKTNEQNKIVDHNWMGNSFHAENLTNTNKIK